MRNRTSSTFLPPGPRPLPLLGNVLAFRRDPLLFIRTLQHRYGHMATIYMGKIPIVLCFRPEHIRYVLVEHPRNFVKPNIRGGNNLRYLLGDGLLTSDGDFHRQQRRLVQPAFHKKRVENYANVMLRFTEEMLDSWKPGSEIDIAAAMQNLTLRIITKTLFNVDSAETTAELGKAFTAVIENSPRFASRWGRSHLNQTYQRRMNGKQTLDTFVYKLIAERRQTGQDMGDVLSMLLEAQDDGLSMTDKQIHDQVLTFVAAGHETAQNTLSWTFCLLSRNPEARQNLQQELRQVLNGRTPTVEDLASLPYLEAVLNESWRFYPPAWTQSRRAVEAFEMDGYRLPAGTVVMLPQWVLHNLNDIWGDPQNFRPERWLNEQEKKASQGAYFPFGAGPRICIGMPFAQMEARLLLATILQRYTPQLVSDFPVVLQPRVTLRPKYGMRMILQPAEQISQGVATAGSH
ncbi:MAG TPA: cytochrome P450 [Ktedonobacteraceae bacterium]|nr:cytochrome P450 [Ktedonobacteraceae bacterium]